MWLYEGELLMERVWNIHPRVQKNERILLPSGTHSVEGSHLGVHKLHSWIIFYLRKGSVWSERCIAAHHPQVLLRM